MRLPDIDDTCEINGIGSLFFIVLGLILILISCSLNEANILISFMRFGYIIGSVFTLIGIIWTTNTILDKEYSIIFLFENDKKI